MRRRECVLIVRVFVIGIFIIGIVIIGGFVIAGFVIAVFIIGGCLIIGDDIIDIAGCFRRRLFDGLKDIARAFARFLGGFLILLPNALHIRRIHLAFDIILDGANLPLHTPEEMTDKARRLRQPLGTDNNKPHGGDKQYLAKTDT